MPIPESPPEWRAVLEPHLARQLPEVGISVREAANLVGIGEPTHMQLQQMNALLTTLGWNPRQLRKPGGGRMRVYFR